MALARATGCALRIAAVGEKMATRPLQTDEANQQAVALLDAVSQFAIQCP